MTALSYGKGLGGRDAIVGDGGAHDVTEQVTVGYRVGPVVAAGHWGWAVSRSGFLRFIAKGLCPRFVQDLPEAAMIRVVIVEELQLTRSALVALLENEVDIRVVAEFAMGRTMVSATTAAQPDVVLVNTDVVGGQVPLAISDLQAIVGPHAVLVLVDPRTPLVLSIARSHHVPSLLIKDVAPWVLADAVRRLAEGKRVVDPRIAMAALVDGDIPLTPRELEILDLASSGETVSEIAARLRLAVGTVRNYLSKIITKTGARNRIDAVRIAREAGWLAGGTRNRIELLPTWPSRHQERPAL